MEKGGMCGHTTNTNHGDVPILQLALQVMIGGSSDLITAATRFCAVNGGD
jgi:hypothetical protein